MNKIKLTGFKLPLLCSGLLILTLSACSEPKTTAKAPDSTQTNGETVTAKNAKTAQNDAQSQTRKKQLNQDIQAREQRNNMGGDPQKRAEEDLASEVRGKLEVNIPNGKLTVSAEKTQVTVSGVVMNQAQLDKIKPLAMEIKGVRSVMVKAVINR
ncbi:MAG: BON domain-containing protein [Microcystaceae cyanobacterium]